MNIYIVVEGPTEEKIYEKWVPLVNPNLRYVDRLIDVVDNDFAIISGGGYPNYLYKVIENAIEDVNDFKNIQKFVVAVDSEEMTRENKFKEINSILSAKKCIAEKFIIIQHFCFETWALGNRIFLRKNTENNTLRKYVKHYNVAQKDPELLLPFPGSEMTRAQFAYNYLRLVINDKQPSASYKKGRPGIVSDRSFFYQVRARLNDTNHILSFQSFIDAFFS